MFEWLKKLLGGSDDLNAQAEAEMSQVEQEAAEIVENELNEDDTVPSDNVEAPSGEEE